MEECPFWTRRCSIEGTTSKPGLLVVPSMEHRLVQKGHSSMRLIGATGFYAAGGLGFLALALMLSTFIVIERHFRASAGIGGGLALGALAVFAWFGVERIIGL